MRKLLLMAIAGLIVASTAYADSTTFLHPVNPNDIKFTPINTASVISAPLPATPGGSFSLRNFFSNFSLRNFFGGSRFGQSALPSYSSFPSTQYKSPLVPVKPIQ
jgi:hypothetical protein